MDNRFTVDGKDYFIKRSNDSVATAAQRVYAKSFAEAVTDGALLRQTLDSHMRKQGLWSDEKEGEYKQLAKEVADLEYTIKSGSLKKASELREASIKLKRVRNKIASLLLQRNEMDSVTAEAMAENERFDYLLSQSVYDYQTQKPVFSSLADYKERKNDHGVFELAQKYANYAYGLDEDHESGLVENRMLRRLGLLNEDNLLVDRSGNRVDYDGNRIDEDGMRIGEDEERVDINNRPFIDNDAIDSIEFEDDLPHKAEEGGSVNDEDQEGKPKRRRPRKTTPDS